MAKHLMIQGSSCTEGTDQLMVRAAVPASSLLSPAPPPATHLWHLSHPRLKLRRRCLPIGAARV